jgi:hypothetical protein
MARLIPHPRLALGGTAVASDWFWALIAGGCVGYLLLETGIIKIRWH